MNHKDIQLIHLKIHLIMHLMKFLNMCFNVWAEFHKTLYTSTVPLLHE